MSGLIIKSKITLCTFFLTAEPGFGGRPKKIPIFIRPNLRSSLSRHVVLGIFAPERHFHFHGSGFRVEDK